MIRATARVRRNLVFRVAAKLCRQYLRWYHNASYKLDRNGERWLLRALAGERLRTLLDVGANVGKWARTAAAAHPEATIYALELVPATFERLRAATADEPRIRCFSVGLAERRGRLHVRYNPAASTHTSFTEYPYGWEGGGEDLECPVLPGDEFLAEQGLATVDFLKIDTEGAEPLVLQGFARALGERRIRFVQFEYSRINIYTKFLLRDFYQLFEGYGYVVGKLFPDHVDVRPYAMNDEDFMGPNYIACPRNDPALAKLVR
jgi:FkbM family methyltransferase